MVYEIGGLPLPADAHADALRPNSALALFHQSARRVDGRFTLTEAEKADVARICRLVGGMPLAIELAASWVRLLSCAEIAGEIERGLSFLAVSLRNIPERHRSIQTVFEHSWNLLAPREQETLAQLSVFRGGFTREAAAQVTGATLPLLSAPVDKSLVRRVETNRFDLHELIRQYAYEQLAQSCDFAAAHNRHFDFYLALAEEAKAKLRGSELILWLNLLERDYDNLRSALEWSLQGAPEAAKTAFEAYRGQKALRLTAALYTFWKIRVYWGNGRKWLQRALDLTATAPPTADRVNALKAAALLAVEQMDLLAANQLAISALALAQELGDPLNIGLTLATCGIVLWKQKEYAAARSHCEEALVHFRPLHQKISIADTLQVLSRIAINQDDLQTGQAYLEECLALFAELDDKMGFNAASSDLGLVAYLRGDFAAAKQYHHNSLRLFREARSLAGIEMTLNRLGDIARCEGDYAEAGRCYRECWALFRDTGDKDEIPSLLHNLGYVALHEGDHAEAMSLFRQGMAVHLDTGNQAGTAECLAGIAAVFTAQGQAETAAHLFGAAEAQREENHAVLWPANRLEYERSLAILHKTLDHKTLKAAWATGCGLAGEQIHFLLSAKPAQR